MSKKPVQLGTDGLDPTRWRTLFVVAISQLMIVLDSSIMNIAIPSAKIDLGISDANQQWVITAYTLAFGSLLLLGGRIGDQHHIQLGNRCIADPQSSRSIKRMTRSARSWVMARSRMARLVCPLSRVGIQCVGIRLPRTQDVNLGRADQIRAERDRIKRMTIAACSIACRQHNLQPRWSRASLTETLRLSHLA